MFERWLSWVKCRTRWRVVQTHHREIADRDAVIAEIAAAFEHVTLGDGITIHEARALENYEAGNDLLVAREKDFGVRWQDIPDATLLRLNDVHGFLCPKGFHFYIAAYLIWSLRHRGDEHSAFAWHTVDSLDPNYNRADNGDRFRHFDLAQRRAICRYFRHLERYDQGWWRYAWSCLKLFWGQYCPEPPDDPTEDFYWVW